MHGGDAPLRPEAARRRAVHSEAGWSGNLDPPRWAPAASGTSGVALKRSRRSRAERLPLDLLGRCLTFLIDTHQDVMYFGLVCRRWLTASYRNEVWLELARRRFCALPILELAEDASSHSLIMRTAGTPVTHRCMDLWARLSLFLKIRRWEDNPCRQSYLRNRIALKAYQRGLVTQREVKDTTPYVLHLLLVASWAAAWVFVLLLILIQEGVQFAGSPLGYGHAFGVLYVVYAFIFLTFMMNVIAQIHFEPMSFSERVVKHRNIIGLSVFSLLSTIFISIVTWLIHGNIVSSPSERIPWVVCFSPGILILGGWQVLALASTARAARQVISQPGRDQLHALLVTAYPMHSAFALAALSVYLDGGQRVYLAAASIPYLVGTVLLTVTFGIDFLNGNNQIADGLSCLSLASLSCLPIGYLLAEEPRGLLLTPVLISLTCHAYPYVSSWRAKLARDRQLRRQMKKKTTRVAQSRGGWG